MNCQKFESVVSELARGQMMAAEQRGEALAHSDACEDCARRLRDDTGGGPSIQSRNAVCCAWAFWPIVFPFVFLNGEGHLVGFDVEMAQQLAGDLSVKVEFVEMEDLTVLPRLLATGRIDLAMTGIVVTPERAGEMLFSEPYLDETLAFVVKDQLREEFSSWATIRDLGVFPVTIPDSPYYIDPVKTRAPALKLQVWNRSSRSRRD